MRGVEFDERRHAVRPVMALGNEWAAGRTLPAHRHARAQLLFAAGGLMTVGTEHGSWAVPAGRAVWIPAGVTHELRFLAAVSTRSLYVAPDAAGVPAQCRVVAVPPLARALLLEAVDLPLEYDEAGRDGLLMALLLRELERLEPLPLALPFPAEPRLAARCRAFLAAPASHDTIDGWAAALGMSRRAFTRLFRQQAGVSFAAWRQQACAFAALPRLAAGEAVTTVALDLGYDSPAAFTSMFKRLLGLAPRDYLRGREGV